MPPKSKTDAVHGDTTSPDTPRHTKDPTIHDEIDHGQDSGIDKPLSKLPIAAWLDMLVVEKHAICI
jgi:hypothetical protein